MLTISDGLRGVLVRNNEGQMHEDSAVDRLLTVRHSGCTTFEIYDKPFPISGSIFPGRPYRFVIVATAFQRLRYPTTPFDGVKTGIWRGVVQVVPWQPIQANYELARPSLFRHHGKTRAWVLLDTPIGPMLVKPDEVKQMVGMAVQPGDILQWEDARFELYALA